MDKSTCILGDFKLCSQQLMENNNIVQLFAAPWTIAHQAPLSMGFSRQESWSKVPLPTPVHLPNPGIEPVSLASPALAGRFFTTSATWEVPWIEKVDRKSAKI